MKVLPAVASGIVAALVFYAGLRIADPAIEVNNPWLVHFRDGGFETHLRATSGDINRRIAVVDWRGRLKGPPFDGTKLVSLTVDGASVQVLELPTEEGAQELVKRKPPRGIRCSREGRFVCIITPGMGPAPSAADTRKLQDHFKTRAGGLP